MENTDVISKIVANLDAVNKDNFSQEHLTYLKQEDFPAEYGQLIQSINKAIATGNNRVKKTKTCLYMLNSAIQSGMWYAEFDENSNLTGAYWSDSYRQMLGYKDKSEFPDGVETWRKHIHPEDRKRTVQLFYDAVKGICEYDVEYRYLTKNSGYKWFHSVGKFDRRKDGTPTLLVGTFIDITQKLEHDKLMKDRMSNQKVLENLKDALQNSNDILTGLCVDFVAVYLVNLETGIYEIFKISDKMRAGSMMLAYSNSVYDKMIKEYIDTYVYEEDKDYVWTKANLSRIKQLLKTNKTYAVRYRLNGFENPEDLSHFEIYFAISGENRATVGFRNVDNIIREQEAYKLEMWHDIAETLQGAKIGIWNMEFEEDKKPRLYGDTTMLRLVDAKPGDSPEMRYEKFLASIDPEYKTLVTEGVTSAVLNGKGTAEVTYPWYHNTMQKRLYIRCGAILDTKFEKPGYALKGYHQDITETIEMKEKQEKALMEALVEAKRANEVKSEFLSHMSHDIRTPINGILGMLTIAEDKNCCEDLERQKECRAKIRNAAEHLLSLINDVLDISKLESGAVSLEKKPFNMNDVLDSCYNILSPQAEETGIFLDLKRNRIKHPRLMGSALHVRQILINIIGNAIKYNKQNGKVFVCVEEVSSDEKEAVYLFSVRDTGIGMSEEFLKRLYEPFAQENEDARTYYKGTGLGMTITKKLVDEMKGTIFVKSVVGLGSEFIVKIPFEINVNGIPEPHENIDALIKLSHDISGMKILLVDDNEINSEIAQYMLESNGAKVIIVRNGYEAVSMFIDSNEGELDCILMDVMMPVMDGLEATRRIRRTARSDSKTVPIIALSANAFTEDVDKAMAAGMTDYLLKPLEMKKLLSTIAAYRKTESPQKNDAESSPALLEASEPLAAAPASTADSDSLPTD